MDPVIYLRTARRRMGALLSSDSTQARLMRLNVDIGEFCADVMQAYANNIDVAKLDESEVFAICEMAARLNLSIAPAMGDARLTAARGRAKLLIGFPALYKLLRASNAHP